MNRREFLTVVGGCLFINKNDKKENKNDKKEFKSIIIAYADKPNGNKRVYTKKVLKEAFKNLKCVSGTINPSYDSEDKRVASHIAYNFRMNDNKVLCDMKILDTIEGRKLENNINQFVFRTCGIGNVDHKNDLTFVKDYRLLTIDAIPVEKTTKI